MPVGAHAAMPATGILTVCAQGAHADVILSPAFRGTAGPGTFSIAKNTCSDLNLQRFTYTVSLADHGRTPLYGPSTADDGGNFGFGEQPFDHTTVKYTALPPGGMSYTTGSPSVTVDLGANNQNRGSGVEVDFVFANQLH
jgi:hypothetical protein